MTSQEQPLGYGVLVQSADGSWASYWGIKVHKTLADGEAELRLCEGTGRDCFLVALHRVPAMLEAGEAVVPKHRADAAAQVTQAAARGRARPAEGAAGMSESDERPRGLVPGSGRRLEPKALGCVLSVRLSGEEYGHLLWLAEQEGTTVSEQVRRALRKLPSVVWSVPA